MVTYSAAIKYLLPVTAQYKVTKTMATRNTTSNSARIRFIFFKLLSPVNVPDGPLWSFHTHFPSVHKSVPL